MSQHATRKRPVEVAPEPSAGQSHAPDPESGELSGTVGLAGIAVRRRLDRGDLPSLEGGLGNQTSSASTSRSLGAQAYSQGATSLPATGIDTAHEQMHVLQQRAGVSRDDEKDGETSETEDQEVLDEALGTAGVMFDDEEKRQERATKREGGLTDDSVDGIGTMFGDEEKRGQRRRKKGSGGLTDDSVGGVDKMIGDEQKIADKKDQRRARKGKGGLTLASAADVAELFDLQDRDWFTNSVTANPETPKKYLAAGTEVFKDNNGFVVSAGTINKGFVAEIKKSTAAEWVIFDLGGKTYFAKTADLREDPTLSHVREDGPVFPLDKSGDPLPPKPDDVKQYGLGDCYLESALTALAATNPNQITEMIKDYGNTVTVRLYDVQRDKVKKDQADPGEYKANTPAKFTQKLIRVEKSRVRKGGNLQYDSGALWVGLIEKAYAAGKFGGTEDQTDQARKPGQNASYGNIEGGFERYAWEVLLGRPSLQFDITQGEEQTALGRKDMPWSPFEISEHKKNAKRMFGGSYSGLVSYEIFDKSKKKVDAWMKWVNGKGVSAIGKLFTDLADEKAGGYGGGTLRLEDFELVFADNGLSTDLAVPVLTYLEAYFPGKRGSGKYTRDQLRLWHQIVKAMKEGILVGVDTNQKVGRSASGAGISGGEAMTKGLAGGHAYTLLGTSAIGDLKFVKLRNPWGKYSRDYDVSEKDGKKKLAPKAIDEGDGTMMLELTDLTKRFNKINFS